MFRGSFRREPIGGPTRGATGGPIRGSNFAFACSVLRPQKYDFHVQFLDLVFIPLALRMKRAAAH